MSLAAKTFVFLLMLSGMTLGLVSCGGDDDDDGETPNPASVKCEEDGHNLQIRKDEDGNEYGVCLFSDSTECEEWAYYNGECAPGDCDKWENCSKTQENESGTTRTNENENTNTQLANPASEKCVNDGYYLQIRTDENGGQYGVCMFTDGSECEEWAYYRGECEPGQE